MMGVMLGSRGRAGLAAAALFLAGALVGLALDRLWLAREPAEATAAPLTIRGLGQELDLNPTERARLSAVLDSLRGEVAAAVEQSPGSLRVVARRARARLEEAIPPGRRAEFRDWMEGHHQRMMQRMGPMIRGDMRMHDMMGPDSAQGPGMMRRGSGRRRPDS